MNRHIAEVSWGRDSLGMLLYVLEHPEQYPLDEVVFYDTGMEFQAIYNNRNKMLYYLAQGASNTRSCTQTTLSCMICSNARLRANKKADITDTVGVAVAADGGLLGKPRHSTGTQPGRFST